MLRTTNSVGPTAVYSLGYYDFKESVVETGAESEGLVAVGTVSDGSASDGSASEGSASDGVLQMIPKWIAMKTQW